MTQFQNELREVFGVGERAQMEWFTHAERAWSGLKAGGELVMHRHLRAQILLVCNDVSNIIRNCQADPDDIREEPVFPAMVERLAAVVDDYVKSAGVTSLASSPDPKVKKATELFAQAHQAFTKLLQTMQQNDDKDFSLRTSVMSSVFRRFPDPEGEQVSNQ